jgi:transcriptional regulator with XRE-family HTH domain
VTATAPRVYSILCYNLHMSERRDILRQVMDETRTSQSELSRMSGVHQPSISQMLGGRVELSDDMLHRLLSCMGFGFEVVYRPIPLNLTKSVRRSWRLHRRLSTHLDGETFEHWTPLILQNLQQMNDRVRGEPHTENLRRWHHLVEGRDLPGLRRVLTGLDEISIQMREVSPMRGLLSQAERSEVLGQAS